MQPWILLAASYAAWTVAMAIAANTSLSTSLTLRGRQNCNKHSSVAFRAITGIGVDGYKKDTPLITTRSNRDTRTCHCYAQENDRSEGDYMTITVRTFSSRECSSSEVLN